MGRREAASPRRPSVRAVCAFFSLILAFAMALPLAAQANPFTVRSGQGAVAPVRGSRPVAALVRMQADLKDAIAERFSDWRVSASPGILFSVLAAAFLYGFFHALGPGHRKTVVFSLYLARKAPWWEPLGMGILLSILHAGISVILMLILKGASGSLSASSGRVAVWMEGIAYSLLVILSLGLLIHALQGIIRRKPHEDRVMGAGAIILTGFFPCPGAILILVLSLSLGMMGLGIAAVASMSLGMSIPIIVSGYLAWLGRQGLFLGLKKHERTLSTASGIVEMSGYLILLAFSLFLALPFIESLFRLSV